MNEYLVFSCSLNPSSKSRRLAAAAREALAALQANVELIDLREWPLPFCDGNAACESDQVVQLTEKVAAAQCILFAVPIYNYDASAAAKNLVELLGSQLEGKIVGFLCAAGGHSSYMSVMGLAGSLMLDFRCLVIPRFVYATGEAFGPSEIKNPDVRRRIDQLAREAVRITTALQHQPRTTQLSPV